MTIKAVLFDLDDTLYGDFATCDRLGLQAAGRYAEQAAGLDASQAAEAMRRGRLMLRDTCKDEPESHDRVLFAKLGLESIGVNPIPYAEGMHAAYWDAVLNTMERREDVLELLTRLKEANIPVGICTNMMADIQLRKLCRLGLADVCGIVTTSEEAGRDKPHAPIFQLAVQRLGVPAQETLMVGDNFNHDVRGALAAGLQAMWLNVHGQPLPVADTPAYVAADFPDAARQILRLCDISAQ
ncbi:MAG: HAD family hydrolase [Butyricicoccus sp.]|nr:HAD family hydrolase [Butyricicoccus sp.]